MSVVAGIVSAVAGVADELFTSDEERARVDLERHRIDAALITGQLSVNAVEARHNSVFVAGWRPFIGWVGGFSLAYQFLLYPLLLWGVALSGVDIIAPPVLDADELWVLVSGMLGIAGMRSFDKLKGKSTERIT